MKTSIVRLSDDQEKETIVASDILCLISPVDGEYEQLNAIGRRELRFPTPSYVGSSFTRDSF